VSNDYSSGELDARLWKPTLNYIKWCGSGDDAADGPAFGSEPNDFPPRRF
jgi:hypothetical protein